jgi:hypothetical protein
MRRRSGGRGNVAKKAKLSEFKTQRQNANAHTARGLGMLAKSIGQDGWIGGMTVAADGEAFDGSARLETLADAMPDAEPIIVHTDGTRPVVVVRDDIPSASDPRAKRLGIAANRIQQVDYAPDPVVLAELAGEIDLSQFWDKSEIDEILGKAVGNDAADPGADTDRAAELLEKWQVKPGDVWVVGKHRLICGDSTDAAVVKRLMGDERAEMIWTDPPYGVAIGDKNKYLNSIGPANRVESNLENDTLDEPALLDMLKAAFANAAAVCLAGGAWYVAAPPGPLHVLFGQTLKDMGIWRQTIQWVKNNATFSPLGVDYHWRAEPIFYGWLPGAGHRYHGGRKQDTVWEIDRPAKSPR